MKAIKTLQIDEHLPFALPLIEEEEIKEVLDTLKSGWITTGPKTKRFEAEFAKFVGARHAIAVNSCTAALHLALEAIGVSEGDEVITTPMTFAATAEVIRYFKARPVFVDIDPVTMNIDVEKLEETVERSAKGGRLKAIVPVHFAGYPCDMDSIIEIARKHNVPVIEDAAHAFPARYKGRMVGTIGDITAFSFYATKNITTGEGGMITTDNDEWADRMRIMSLHGISRDAWKRYTAEGNWFYEILSPGYKYNLTDIAAAIGLAQLKKAHAFREYRAEIAARYNEAFERIAQITPPILKDEPETSHGWHLYVIKLNLENLSIDRNRFIEELRARGIGTSVHFIPLHIHPYYRDTYGYRPEDFPAAYGVFQRIISLPMYPKMTPGDVDRVIDAVLDVASLFKA